MKLSQLSNFLSNKITARILSDCMKEDIINYQKSSKGGSIPITVMEDDNLYIRYKDICTIGYAFLYNNLSVDEVSYIADVLTLSNQVRFETEDVFSVVETLTDPEVNGILSKEYIREVLFRIENA